MTKQTVSLQISGFPIVGGGTGASPPSYDFFSNPPPHGAHSLLKNEAPIWITTAPPLPDWNVKQASMKWILEKA